MGYAGPVLRSQGSFGEDRLSRGAGGEGLIASNARSGPIPLRPRSGLCLGRLGGGLFGLFFFGSGSSAGALVGSAGPCLRSQDALERMSVRAVREGRV